MANRIMQHPADSMLMNIHLCALLYVSCHCSLCRAPRAVNMPNAQSVGNPHPDATGLNKAAGIDVLLTLQYTRTNLSGPTYMVTQPSCSKLSATCCFLLPEPVRRLNLNL